MPPLLPHPPVTRLYSDGDSKRRWLDRIFGETARDYERVERVLSLGSGRWYRRQALRRAGLSSGMAVVDVAAGTGLVAREAAAIVGPGGRVAAVDACAGMIAAGGAWAGVQRVVALAEALPFADGSFDFLSMGYALRHMADVRAAFAEFYRVLRGGGRVCVLEITRPRSRMGRAALRAYMRVASSAAGLLGRLGPRTPELWRYYWETIDACVPPEVVMEAMRDAGFIGVERRRALGVFSEFVGTRPD